MQPNPIQPQKRVSKKVQQFLNEINDLSKHYQYRLEARIECTPRGIIPTLTVVEALPEKKTPRKKTAKKEVKKGKKNG